MRSRPLLMGGVTESHAEGHGCGDGRNLQPFCIYHGAPPWPASQSCCTLSLGATALAAKSLQLLLQRKVSADEGHAVQLLFLSVLLGVEGSQPMADSRVQARPLSSSLGQLGCDLCPSPLRFSLGLGFTWAHTLAQLFPLPALCPSLPEQTTCPIPLTGSASRGHGCGHCFPQLAQ